MKYFVHVLFVLLAVAYCQANETVKLIPGTYQFRNSIRPDINTDHWNKNQILQVLNDQFPTALDDEIDGSVKEIVDMSVMFGIGEYEIYFITKNSNFVNYNFVSSLDNFPGDMDSCGRINNSDLWIFQTLHSPTGVDAWQVDPLTRSTRLVVSDYARSNLVFYRMDRDPDAAVQINNIFCYNTLRHVVDVVKWKCDGAFWRDYVCALTWDGTAIVLYRYDSNWGTFMSSWGLAQSLVPNEVPDDHCYFFDHARSLTSQHDKVYVCDTGNHRICQFGLTDPPMQRLRFEDTYDLGSDVLPTYISGDKEGSLFVVDETSNQIIKLSTITETGAFNGPMRIVDRIVRLATNLDETSALDEPLTATAVKDLRNGEQEMLISEKLDDNSGFVRGRLGGRISRLTARVDQQDSRIIHFEGLSTGNCNDLKIHSRRVGTFDDIVTDVAPSVKGRELPPLQVLENREFGNYEFWISWESESCTYGNAICTYPEDHISVRCGLLGSLTEAPTNLRNCSLAPSNEFLICWDPLPLVQEYFIAWQPEQNPQGGWIVRNQTNNLVLITGLQPLTVYPVVVKGVRFGQAGPPAVTYVAVAPTAAPASSAVVNRTATEIRLQATLPTNANGYRVYFGTDPNNLTCHKDFLANEPLILSYASNELNAHDQIWHFQVAGAMLSTTGALAAEGPRSDMIRAPLAPTVPAVVSTTPNATIRWPERWFAEYDPNITFEGMLNIGPEGSLTIDPGIHVEMTPSPADTMSGILVYGSLQAVSEILNQPITFHMANRNNWATQINVRGGTLSLKNAEVIGPSWAGVCGVASDITIDECLIAGCDNNLILAHGSARVENSIIERALNRGVYIINCDPQFSKNMIQYNAQCGVMINTTAYTYLNNNTISHNGSAGVSLWNGGVCLLNGYVNLHCNTMIDNGGTGLAVLQGFADLTTPPSDYPGGRNTIQGNCVATGMETIGQVFLEGTASLGLDYGLNSISAPVGHLLIQYAQPDELGSTALSVPENDPLPPNINDPSVIYARRNYWGTTDMLSIRTGIQKQAMLNPILQAPVACDAPNQPIVPDIAESATLFREGMLLEFAASYEGAEARYDSILEFYPKSKEMAAALTRIQVCKVWMNTSWPDIQAYFQAIADTAKDSDMKMAALNTRAWCFVAMNEVDSAIVAFQALIDSSTKSYEVIYNSMGLLLAELGDEGWIKYTQLSKTSGSKSSRALTRTEDEDLVTASRTYQKKLASTFASIDSLLGMVQPSAQQVLLPTKFALYQNYPNPFNPTTEIKFDLPEAVSVELRIYNILGQEVTKLIDDFRPAGAYRIAWDSKNSFGSSVASGVYIYQIRAGNFTSAKKMVLMR